MTSIVVQGIFIATLAVAVAVLLASHGQRVPTVGAVTGSVDATVDADFKIHPNEMRRARVPIRQAGMQNRQSRIVAGKL